MASLNIKNTALILAGMIAGGVISVGIYTYYSSANVTAKTGQASQKEARKVLFWYDPMYPNTRFDKPGKSPFMDMDLIPKYADEETASASAPGVRIDPTQTQKFGSENRTCAPWPAALCANFPG
ncbi:copper/silver efflux system membrane fusion protein CusB [Citrobacter freundii]|nr:copper/silver efflux system membrane fusion protein CusB [Citrobacter freundii]